MSIKGFDYKGIAENLTEQAKDLVPEDLCDYAKKYLLKTLENYTLLAGKNLYKDRSLKLNAEQAKLITQIITEWTFHKCVDLARSGIDSKYWDEVMQQIAFVAYEVAKHAMQKKLSQEQLIQVVEYHVVKIYNQAIDELFNDKKISEEVVELAKIQSNIDTLAEGVDAVEDKNEELLDEFEYKITYSTKMSLFQRFKEFLFAHHE